MQKQHSHQVKGRNLLLTILLNLVITIAEIIGGILSNSLALLSDALHNLSDAVSVLISLIAHKISQRDSNLKKTFGYKRIEILAALFNSVVLIVISIYLFREAFLRLQNPSAVKGLLMFVIAGIGLLANIGGVLLLKSDAQHNLNIKASYIHLFTDALSSIAVIIGGLLIYFYHIYWLDPLLTFVIGAYIIYEALKIIKETIDILMQGTPKGIDLEKIQVEIESIDLIKSIHHIHVWNLSDYDIHFEAHLMLVEDLKLSETDQLKTMISEILERNYQITHITLQIEYNCDQGNGILYREN